MKILANISFWVMVKRCRKIICYAFEGTIKHVKGEYKKYTDLMKTTDPDTLNLAMSIYLNLTYVNSNTTTSKAVVKFNELLKEQTKKDKDISDSIIFKILKDALDCDLNIKNINAFNPSVNFNINNHGYNPDDYDNFISEVEGQLDDFKKGKHDNSIKSILNNNNNNNTALDTGAKNTWIVPIIVSVVGTVVGGIILIYIQRPSVTSPALSESQASDEITIFQGDNNTVKKSSELQTSTVTPPKTPVPLSKEAPKNGSNKKNVD